MERDEGVDIQGREVLVKSADLLDGKVGRDTTVWLRV
jgi:hypothetical protein